MRNKGVLTWVLIVGAVLVLLNVPTPVSRSLKSMVRESIAPLQHVLSGFTARVKESASSFRGMGGMLQDNREMAEELVHLRSKLRTLEAVENENIRLRSQLHFAQRSVRALVPCQVIGRDVSGWWNTVRLGCGAVDGVMNNNAVITSEGLVGKTIDVSRRVCDVLLISDSSCKVSVQIPRTGSFGVLEGRGDAFGDKAQCTMTFINKNVEIRPGDEVVTSGMGGVYPEGILVGYVENVFMDDAGLYQYADVLPKADLGMLKYLFVISEEDDEMSELLREKGPIRPGQVAE